MEKTVTDAGHVIGSSGDPGAVSADQSSTEASPAFLIETATNAALTKFGIDNTRTRTTDPLIITQNQVNYRVNIAKNSGGNVFVSHHLNVGENRILLLYHPVETKEKTNGSSEGYETNSLQLASYLTDELGKVFKGRDIVTQPATKPNIRFNTLGVLRGFDNSERAGILIELGAVNNEDNVAFLKTNATQIGNAIATAMYRQLHNGEMPPSEKPENQKQSKPVNSSTPLPKVYDPNEIHSFGDLMRNLTRWMSWGN